MSIEAKETISRNGKLKGCKVFNGNIVDKDGEVIDLVSVLSKLYEDNAFDLSVTSKSEADIDIEADAEASMDEDGNLIYE